MDVTSFDFISLYPANENISDCPRLGKFEKAMEVVAGFATLPLIQRNRALEVRGTRACHPGPRVTKSLSPMASLLNSARRHSISPRRGRRVERGDPRRGSERLHFRARRIC